MESVDIVSAFRRQRIGVIGDVMLDHYLMGDAERISQEAPTPIVLVREERFLPGGAANTAVNIAALGGRASLVGIFGTDEAGMKLRAALSERGIDRKGMVECSRASTIEKIRLIARGQQIVRIDKETASLVPAKVEQEMLRSIAQRIPQWDALALSDYGKGALTPTGIKSIIALARKHRKPIVVDTKPQHFLLFRKVSVLTPNVQEAQAVLGRALDTDAAIAAAARVLEKKTNSSIVITRGAGGMTVCVEGAVEHLPSVAREVFDVTGAGDTVLATMALALASGAGVVSGARLANIAAGMVVGKRGTASVSGEELAAALSSSYGHA